MELLRPAVRPATPRRSRTDRRNRGGPRRRGLATPSRAACNTSRRPRLTRMTPSTGRATMGSALFVVEEAAGCRRRHRWPRTTATRCRVCPFWRRNPTPTIVAAIGDFYGSAARSVVLGDPRSSRTDRQQAPCPRCGNWPAPAGPPNTAKWCPPPAPRRRRPGAAWPGSALLSVEEVAGGAAVTSLAENREEPSLPGLWSRSDRTLPLSARGCSQRHRSQ